MFQKIIIESQENLFFILSKTTKFEEINKGRQGAILVDTNNKSKIPISTTKYNLPSYPFLKLHNDLLNNNNKQIPISRSTTKYKLTAKPFLVIHYKIIDNIKHKTVIKDLVFNNAMI